MPVNPRNSLVLLRLLSKKEEKIGGVVLADGVDKAFTEAEVVRVGPGSSELLSSGARSDTHDLKPGQRVQVGHKKEVRQGIWKLVGLQINEGGEVLHLFEQNSIVAILAEPGQSPSLSPEKPVEANNGPKLVV